MTKIKPGTVVTIYQDPTTQSKPEGRARLYKLLIDGYDQQLWRVRFDEDNQYVERWILKS